ncbi:hypothetical protein DFH06DRAFT_1099951 [Mycena polygramma]|nr:hypothetical protein DFH06DRAFT_1099951 [Mycena polygramma]
MHPQSPDAYHSPLTGRTTPTPRRRNPRPPSPTPDPSYEEILSLDFVCRRKSHSILNSTVVGRDGYTPYFHIMTQPGSTVFRTNDGRSVGSIEWRGKCDAAYVELPGTVSKQRVSKWLGVSSDASYRIMRAFGEHYIWVPQSDTICMYHWNPAAVGDVPRLLARVEKEGRKLTLEITVEAINRGLLEMTVVATTLFQSGCSIQ